MLNTVSMSSSTTSTTMTSPAVSGSGSNVRPKLSSSFIFDKMRPLICSIRSSAGESSGFFIDRNGTVLTAAHNVPLENVNGRTQFVVDSVQVGYGHQDRPRFAIASTGILQEAAAELDMFSVNLRCRRDEMQFLGSAVIPIIQFLDSDAIPMLPPNVQLKEGMKVYFAGYPLGQETITFHKGVISSITADRGVRKFTIDGTVVPGNSGGPVVIQHEGAIYLAGVITAEVADFSPEDLKTISIMKALSERRRSPIQMPAPNAVWALSAEGIDVPVQISTPQGVETVVVNDRDTICLALDLIQRNLSTGIGKAVDIRHYEQLFRQEQESKVERRSGYSFPVTKGKKVIQGMLRLDGGGAIVAKYCEVLYGNKGGGNRGVRILLCPPHGSNAYTYKISPNPHTASGNYNKNQAELYFNAAKQIVTCLLNQQPHQTVSFDACQSSYTAELDS